MTEAESGFDLPDALTPEKISETRKEFLQLLYEEPGHPAPWYTNTLGVNGSYLANLQTDFPDLFDRSPSDTRHMQYDWELAEDAESALLDAGVIEPDMLAESRRCAEVPQQKQERGNVTTVGTLDLTDLPPAEGSEQSIQDRPVKPSADTPDRGDSEDDRPAPPSREGNRVLDISLSGDDVFEIVRKADYWTARHVFEQLICDHEDGTDE